MAGLTATFQASPLPALRKLREPAPARMLRAEAGAFRG